MGTKAKLIQPTEIKDQENCQINHRTDPQAHIAVSKETARGRRKA
jgi:hypothetical protein